MERSSAHHHDSYVPPREDKYHYYYFSAGDHPWGESLIKQIQAQSYVDMKIVRPEGIVTVQDRNGSQIKILSPDVTSPSGIVYEAPSNSRMEYVLGVEKGSADFSVETGRLVAWRKLYAPLEALPAYEFCKDDLSASAKEYLEQTAASHNLVLVEPEALCKTINAERGAVKELIRAEIQRAFGKGEVWFMGLVEKTVYGSWVHSWGTSAVRRIGKSKKLTHPYNFEDVALVPTIVDIDNFFANMAHDILTPENPSAAKHLNNFLYMSNGMSDSILGEELADFRYWAQSMVTNEENSA